MNSLRFFKAGLRTLSKPSKAGDTPVHIQIEPTTACNLACKSCPHPMVFKNPAHMKLEVFKKIIDQIQPLRITLSGIGEPLLNPQIDQMIVYAHKMGTKVNLTTNGTFLKRRREDLFNAKLDLLSVSIDAANPETYQAIRRKDEFEGILEGIRSVVQRKQELKIDFPKIRTHFVIQSANLAQMAEFVTLSADLGTDAVHFQPLDIIDVVAPNKDFLVGDLTYERIIAAMKEALKVAQRLNFVTNLKELLEDFDLYWKKYNRLTQDEDIKCIMPWFSSYINMKGDVKPCCSFGVHDDIGTMGNVFESGFKEIWNSTAYEELRHEMKNGERPYKICKNCVPRTLVDIARASKFTPGFIKGK